MEGALYILLDNWPSLTLAIDQSEKRVKKSDFISYLSKEVYNAFKDEIIVLHEVMDFLEDIIEYEFNTLIQDKTLELIASDIRVVFNLFENNEISQLENFLSQRANSSTKIVVKTETSEVTNENSMIPENSTMPENSMITENPDISNNNPVFNDSAITNDDSATESLTSDDEWVIVRNRNKK